MFYRRRLPHWHPDITEDTFLFVTWRLAGSVPPTWAPHLPTGSPVSGGRAFLAWDREVDQAAFGPVWLQEARIARVVADAPLYGANERHFYQLKAWVIMPNHVRAPAAEDTAAGDYALAEGFHRATGQPDSGPHGRDVLAG